MFHAHSGWTFERLDDGSVKVSHEGTSIVFDEGTWVSIVANVSANGESGAAYHEALALHRGEE